VASTEPPSGPSRRSFVRYGLLGGVAILVGGGVSAGVLAMRTTALREPRRALSALTQKQYSILAAIADRLCPGADGLPGATELEVAEKVDALLARAEPGVVKEFGAALLLVENALVGAALQGRFTTFSASPADVQDRYLDAWRLSDVKLRRTVWRAIAGLCMASYWSDPRTYAWVGYPGPPDFSGAP